MAVIEIHGHIPYILHDAGATPLQATDATNIATLLRLLPRHYATPLLHIVRHKHCMRADATLPLKVEITYGWLADYYCRVIDVGEAGNITPLRDCWRRCCMLICWRMALLLRRWYDTLDYATPADAIGFAIIIFTSGHYAADYLLLLNIVMLAVERYMAVICH